MQYVALPRRKATIRLLSDPKLSSEHTGQDSDEHVQSSRDQREQSGKLSHDENRAPGKDVNSGTLVQIENRKYNQE
jgi:hypothetical protein